MLWEAIGGNIKPTKTPSNIPIRKSIGVDKWSPKLIWLTIGERLVPSIATKI